MHRQTFQSRRKALIELILITNVRRMSCCGTASRSQAKTRKNTYAVARNAPVPILIYTATGLCMTGIQIQKSSELLCTITDNRIFTSWT